MPVHRQSQLTLAVHCTGKGSSQYSIGAHTVKRASTFRKAQVFAFALVVCLVGLALLHSRVAHALIPGDLRNMVLAGIDTILSPSETSISFGAQSVGSGSSVKEQIGLTAMGTESRQFITLSADRTHLVNTFTRREGRGSVRPRTCESGGDSLKRLPPAADVVACPCGCRIL